MKGIGIKLESIAAQVVSQNRHRCSHRQTDRQTQLKVRGGAGGDVDENEMVGGPRACTVFGALQC